MNMGKNFAQNFAQIWAFFVDFDEIRWNPVESSNKFEYLSIH